MKKRYFDSLRVHDDDLYIEEKTKAHNEIFNNPEKFCNLYIDSTKSKNTYFGTDNTEVYLRRIIRTKDSFKDFSNSPDIKKFKHTKFYKSNLICVPQKSWIWQSMINIQMNVR